MLKGISMQSDQNIPCGLRVMRIFTERPRQVKMMLGEASSSFCILVSGQLKMNKYAKFFFLKYAIWFKSYEHFN